MIPGERWDVAPAEVERLEAEWWQKYSWLEDEYAWVQPSYIRRVLRKGYLSHIVDQLPSEGTLIDFGCGPGWLSIMLAQLGAKHVIGVDNAPAQLEIANSKANAAGLSDKIAFYDRISPETWRSADAVVIHGVLHHLSGNEIDGLLGQLWQNMKPGSKIFILEPVLGEKRYMLWSIPLKIVEIVTKIRRQSRKEKEIRKLLASRGDGPRFPGYGVAPKETPFRVGELERRLSSRFEVTPAKPVLFGSVKFGTELALLAETSPALAKLSVHLALEPYLAWEKVSFSFAPKHLWNGWVFCLFEATPKLNPTTLH